MFHFGTVLEITHHNTARGDCLILVVLSTELLVGHSIRSGLVIQSLCICLRYESTILFNLLLSIFFLLPSVVSGLSTMMA
jgi:hypothetical protein